MFTPDLAFEKMMMDKGYNLGMFGYNANGYYSPVIKKAYVKYKNKA